jgi:peptidoglycan/LPS O-acetylase OafA/YrhL
MVSPVPSTQGGRRSELDGLRGYAAIAVIVFHSLLDRDFSLDARVIRVPLQEATSLYDVVAKFVFMLANGEAAVVIFFILSGTVLFESLRRRDARLFSAGVGFPLRRFIRLYPTFFVFLVAALGAFALVGAYAQAAPHFWRNAGLFDFAVLGASWTLQVEFLAVPFILVAFWCFQRWRAAGVVFAYFGFAALLYTPWAREHLVLCQRFLSCFALGMLIPTNIGAAVARWLPAPSWVVLLAGALVVRHLMGVHWWTMKMMQVFAALLVLQLYYRRAAVLGDWLNHPLSQYLGRLSYSLYLCNVVYLVAVRHWASQFAATGARPVEWGLLLALPIVAASLLTAHIAEERIERPSIAWAHRLTRFFERKPSLLQQAQPG